MPYALENYKLNQVTLVIQDYGHQCVYSQSQQRRRKDHRSRARNTGTHVTPTETATQPHNDLSLELDRRAPHESLDEILEMTMAPSMLPQENPGGLNSNPFHGTNTTKSARWAPTINMMCSPPITSTSEYAPISAQGHAAGDKDERLPASSVSDIDQEEATVDLQNVRCHFLNIFRFLLSGWFR